MLFRRSRLAELEPARRALAEGQYEVAFALLESAARRPWSRNTQALYLLHLASVYALYGADGVEGGALALKDAVRTDAGVTREGLYSALYWEFAAYRGEAVSDVKRGVRRIAGGDEPVARYHAASALLAAGAYRSALRALGPIGGELPAYLAWRRWSLIGQAHESLGRWSEAVEAFEHAVAECTGPEREAERLSLAACRLELGDADGATAILEQVDISPLYQDDLAYMRYLEGRAELERSNPNLALERLLEAASLSGDTLSFGLTYALGQCYAALGRYDRAIDELGRATELAPSEHRAFARHELAYALMEAERDDDAREQLRRVLEDPDYPQRADAFADLAEASLKCGALDEAADAARTAVDLGSVASGCLTLGHVAFEYFSLDEAATWFERAAAASSPGDALWVAAQQMLADIFAQQGAPAAERLYHHARAALMYTTPGSDWYLPLKRYLDDATDAIGDGGRMLN